MKTKLASVAAALLGASVALAACNNSPAPTPAPAVTTPAEEPACEESDIAEGDFLEDCFGITGPGAKASRSPSPSASVKCRRPSCPSR